MKNLITRAILAINALVAVSQPTYADHNDGRGPGRVIRPIPGNHHHNDYNQIPQVAQELAQTLDDLSRAVSYHYRRSSLVYQSQSLARYADSLAERARFQDPSSLGQSIDYLRGQFEGLSGQLRGSDPQISSLIYEARELIQTLEECTYGGRRGPGRRI